MQNDPNAKKLTRQTAVKRWGMLKTERASWIPHYKELSSFILPRNGRYFLSDRNRGQRRDNNILDSTGTRALRILAAGLMAGMTSPARPWFRLTTSDPDLDESADVKRWLNDVQTLMLAVFSKSNMYRSLHSMYEELACFGTSATLILPDHKNIIHSHTLTAGEYAISANYQGQIDTIYREFDMTVSAIVAEFGYENCSINVKNLFDKGALDKWVTVTHAIEPRTSRDASKLDAKNMPFSSIYFETGSRDNSVLRESGFKRFVGLAPRWATAGGDVYGYGPGMECLGDIKQLQHEQTRKGQGIDYKTRPPLQMSSPLQNREIDTLPGGVTFVDNINGGGIKSVFEVNLDLSHLLADIQDVRQRIKEGFYADLFLMLSQANVNGMTATEVAERHEEKLLMLGPVLERLHNELLDPLIEITFDYMMEAGIVPPPPEELQGRELSVEFVSMLAQAQRAVATNGIDRFVNTLGAVAQFKPEVLDKFDSDHWADAYSDMLGIDPALVVPSDKVQEIRAQRAQAQAQQAQAEQMAQASAAAKNLGSAKTSQDTALGGIMNMFSGYNA